LWNTDNFSYSKDEGKRLYQSHPWVMGVRQDGTAFGIIADNTWKQQFELNNPIVISTNGPSFRLVIIEKENPEELLKTLASLTGKMELPPLWALGYQQSRYSYATEQSVKDIALELRKRQLPSDVIWMDIDYMQDYKIFTFDSVRFPAPKKLNEQLHLMDFKTVYMIDPGVKKEKGYFVYDQGTKGNYWVQNSSGEAFNGKVWPGVCAFPDFTAMNTRKWWSSLYKDFMAKGVDGVWNDMNEPSVFDGPDGTMPEDNIHVGDGTIPKDIHLRYHNVYGLLMVKATGDGILKANPGKRPFVLSRSNFLGGQKYAATWTGDNVSNWDHLKLATPMILNLGLSGQPFCGPDLGGFAGSADGKLFANWISIGAFYPFCRNHSSKSSAAQEPWAFGKEVEDISRTALNRRYKLLPYLYTLFWEASQTGLPIMRPMFFADFKDTSLRREQEAFLLGKDLMVVPKWSTHPSLRKSMWKDFNLEENKQDSIQAVLKIRGGSIIPLTHKVIQSTADYHSDSLILLVCLDQNQQASGKIYLDEGEGFGYRSGNYQLLFFNVQKVRNGNLLFKYRQMAGKKNTQTRLFRIGIITDDGIKYSNWDYKNSVSLQFN
jgi:alpha-glucosidase